MSERDVPFAAHSANPPMPLFDVPHDERPASDPPDPAALVMTCANCVAPMDERKCKLICTCGYFASCSDYY